MAKSCALFMVGLVLASLCGANAARIPANSGRKLIVADLAATLGGLVAKAFDLKILFDMTHLPENVEPGKATLMENGQESGVVVILEAGKVNEMTAANVKLDGGVLRVRIRIPGVEKEIVLDLANSKVTLLGGKLLNLVVVFFRDEATEVMHLRDEDGHCLGLDTLVSAVVQDNNVQVKVPVDVDVKDINILG